MRYPLFIAIFGLLACTPGQSEELSQDNPPDSLTASDSLPQFPVLDSVAFGLNADTAMSYQVALNKLKVEKARLRAAYSRAGESEKEEVLTQAGQLLENSLINRIFPFWYGTPWDFNGISNTPGEGEIACGYFVSTTLKHAGLNVNRYRLAQQSSAKACEKLACGDTMSKFCPSSQVKMAEKLVSMGDGLYTIGLDYHVGFVLVRKGQAFFIHSTFLASEGVVIEKAEESPAFYSTCYVVNRLIPNRRFIRTWLFDQKIVVVP